MVGFTSSSVCYVLPCQVLPASGRDAFLQSNHPFASILVCVILQVGKMYACTSIYVHAHVQYTVQSKQKLCTYTYNSHTCKMVALLHNMVYSLL